MNIIQKKLLKYYTKKSVQILYKKIRSNNQKFANTEFIIYIYYVPISYIFKQLEL